MRLWLEAGVLVWAGAAARVDMGLEAPSGRMRVVGKERGDGWESSVMVLTAVGSSRAQYNFELVLLCFDILWDICGKRKPLRSSHCKKTDGSSW